MERVWATPGVANPGHVTRWRDYYSNDVDLVPLRGTKYPVPPTRWPRPAPRGLTPEGLRILRSYRSDQNQKRTHSND